jgi:hypothetical protein
LPQIPQPSSADFLRRLALRLAGVTLLANTACSAIFRPGMPVPSTTRPGAAATAEPPPSPSAPTETAQVDFGDTAIWPGIEPGQWRVVGLARNKSPFSLRDIRLGVSVVSASGDVSGEVEVEIPLGSLGEAAGVPWEVGVVPGFDPVEPRVRIVSFAVDEREPHSIAAHQIRVFRAEDGRAAAIGYLSNPGRSDAVIRSWAALFRDSDGMPFGVGEISAGIFGMRAGERAPFLALGPIGSPETAEIFIDATSAALEASSGFASAAEPRFETTEQGRRFLVAQVFQLGGPGRLLNGVAAVLNSSRLMAVGGFSPPLPLGPAERVGFAVWDLPGLPGLRTEQGEALEIQLWFDLAPPALPAGRWVTLGLEVHQQEDLGGSVHLRGNIHNNTDGEVLLPSLYASVYELHGELATGGWTTVAETLSPRNTAQFLLALPVPADFDPVSAEYDLRAFGWVLEP